MLRRSFTPTYTDMNRLTISLILFFLSAMASLKGVGVLGEAFSSVRRILGVQLADLQQTLMHVYRDPIKTVKTTTHGDRL